MEREEILKLAEDSNIELSEEEIKRLQKDFDIIKQKYDLLEGIDTEGIEPLFSVLEGKIVNRFNEDEILSDDKKMIEEIIDRDKMVDDFYQVPNKEGN